MSGTTIDGDDYYVMLADLPEDDPLRNAQLQTIGAEYFHVKTEGEWKPVTPDKFWGFTYNDLYGPWVVFHRWRAPRLASNSASNG